MKPGEQDIEKLLINQINQLEVTEGQIKNLNEKYFKLDKKLENAFQKVGLVRYNAFNDLGGNLSFAIALLNSKNDGFLINGIHGREGSYTYVKTIENGQPSAQVSNEEKEALKQAINR
jgi:lysozyme family protein